MSPAGWLPRTGISSGTLRWTIEYWLPLLFYFWLFTLSQKKKQSVIHFPPHLKMHQTNLWSRLPNFFFMWLKVCIVLAFSVLAFSVHAFSILAKCAVSYLPFPYLHFPVLAFSAPPPLLRLSPARKPLGYQATPSHSKRLTVIHFFARYFY